MDMRVFPNSLIKMRFTKRAKDGQFNLNLHVKESGLPKMRNITRHETLTKVATLLNSIACKSNELYHIILETTNSLINQLQGAKNCATPNTSYGQPNNYQGVAPEVLCR